MVDPTRISETTAAHAICGAKTRSGAPCKAPPMLGQRRCRMHGGASPAARRKAAERLEKAALARQMAEWGMRLDVSAPEALLEQLQITAGEVAFWQHMTSRLDDGQRAGMQLVKSTTVGGGVVDTFESRIHLFVAELHKAQDRLVAYSSAAVKANLDEAMVRLATLQGGLVLEVARRVLAAREASPDVAGEDLIRGVLEGW